MATFESRTRRGVWPSPFVEGSRPVGASGGRERRRRAHFFEIYHSYRPGPLEFLEPRLSHMAQLTVIILQC